MITDLHSHILPGVDDGPSTLDGSFRLARAFVGSGTERVVSTPHVNHRWGVRAGTAQEAFTILVDALADESIDLDLKFGGELALTTAIELSDETLDAFRLGDGEWLLIEPPASGPSSSIHGMIFGIQSRGYRILLAHPERCQTFQDDVELLDSLVAGGVRTQITAGALTGGFGSTACLTAKRFFERNLVHTVASDAHDAELRPPGLAKHLKDARLEWMHDWLCGEIPEMILNGGPEPKAPTKPTSIGGWRRVFGRS